MNTEFRITARSEKFKHAIVLATMSLFCICLSFFRYYFTGKTMFLFLNWNLFLASIPWILCMTWEFTGRLQKTKISFALLLSSWLLFFPNSPYILTDLIHLKQRGNFPVWYDLILILAFAWTGLSFGLYSLNEIEKMISRKISATASRIISIMLLFVTSFGVYLGRFLRWNSWDIFREPVAIIRDIADRFIDPFSHPRTWAITFLLGIFLNMIYFSFRPLKTQSQNN